MTKQYIGNGLYEIHIGHQKITLSEDEVEELCEECTEKLEKTLFSLEARDEELSFLENELKKKDVEILRLMDDVEKLHQNEDL